MLGKAEKECQRSISHMFSQDWFFKTLVEGEEEVTELAKVLPCVPNFCSLGFNAAGEPFPVGICMVSETLASLRTSAKTFQAKEKSGTATDTTESFRRSFTRSKASEDSIRFIAEKSSTELCAVTDDISANVSVDSTGHVDFIIDPEHPTLSTHGAYISSKSLLTITQEQTQGGIEPTGFGVKILATSCVKTIVGFVADTREVRPAKTLSQAAQAASIDMFLDEELGAASGSIGLDCLGGVVRFRCPGGSGSVEVPGGPVQAGEHVLATLQRKAGGAWEVVFEMRSRAKGVRPAARCVFGTFSAAELYPCVQLVAVPPRAPSAQLGWAPGRALLRVKVVSAWGLHGAGHGLRSHRSGLFGNSGVSDPYYCVCELRGGHASRAAFKTKVVPNGLRPVWDAECGFGGYLPEEWLVFTVMRKHSHSSSTVGHAAIHSVDFLPHGFHGELLLRDPFDPARQEAFINVAIEASDSHDDMEAILTGVSGRWEPQADTGFEASADIGSEASPSQTLGSGDGQRLSGRARLALNFEPMNGATAEGIGQMFHVLFNHMMHMYSEKHEHGLLSDLALYWLTESVLRGVDCANHEVNALSSVDLGKHSRNDIGAEVSTMYEPLVVEYLSLENMIVDEALWWDVVRFQAGQHEVVRAKVEALCAFVEAHVSIRDNAVTGRYPQFVKFIDQVILKAKNNMQRICDLQPDRWYFAKHTLALRFILRNRLDKLRGMVAAGLLTARDVGVLEKDLRMRLAETELYNGSYRRACSRWCARRCRASTWSNVWDYAGAGRPVA
ncbi:unnamed protein product [Prorocentrum cordatum]|uniref:C2 domain-containing protein n=1 Tax=Prorocentrum cordatum TaxID=2364126 RepID=A0ABN9S0Y6_9DINO|nr:unnamed protein product [Polarella glacialis]